MKVEIFLVTGAAGFVGACLTRRLAADGACVHVIVQDKTDMWRLAEIESKLNIHIGDLTDADFVERAVKRIRPTVIYHLAAHGAYPSQKNPNRIMTTNILGTLHLLEALSGIEYKLFLSAGSSSEYGFKDKPMRETDMLEPNSFYAVAKASQAMLCQYAARVYGKPVVTFRFFSVYGPYEEPTRLIPVVLRACLAGKDFPMTDKNTARDFVFVDDVVDACLNIDALRNHGGSIFNIGTGKQTNLERVVACALKVTGSASKPKWGGMPDRIWDTHVWVGDVSKAKQVLNWEAKTPLSEGLTQTAVWLKQQ